MLAAADFLTLHLPLTDETRGSIDADGLREDARRRPDRERRPRRAARRGRRSLEALRSGKVAAAALDVFSDEPYSGPLLELDNVVVTPHLAASTEEAQDRAGVIVAEQVAAALEGALVTNAVNIPSIGAEDLEVLGPFIPLAAKLGRLAMELAGGRAERIELAYYGALSGYDTRLLTVAALNGAFQGRVDQPVNYVNAPVIAAERGIEVVEERRRASRDFTNLVRVAVRANGDELRVAGTTIGREHRRWLVERARLRARDGARAADGVFRYDDVPGVIGRVGTLFGEAGVNIANMAVSRTHRGGKALMALSIDSPAPPELVDRRSVDGRASTTSYCRFELEPRDERARWPEPVERVAGVPAPGWAPRRGSRSSPAGRRPPRTRPRAVGCKLGQIVKSLVFDCDGALGARARPGRPPRRRAPRSPARRARRRRKIASPEQVEEATGFVAGRRRAVPAARSRPRPRSTGACSSHERVWVGAGSPEPHGGALAGRPRPPRARHSLWTSSRPPRNL